MPQARAHKTEQKTNYKLEKVVLFVFLYRENKLIMFVSTSETLELAGDNLNSPAGTSKHKFNR